MFNFAFYHNECLSNFLHYTNRNLGSKTKQNLNKRPHKQMETYSKCFNGHRNNVEIDPLVSMIHFAIFPSS